MLIAVYPWAAQLDQTRAELDALAARIQALAQRQNEHLMQAGFVSLDRESSALSAEAAAITRALGELRGRVLSVTATSGAEERAMLLTAQNAVMTRLRNVAAVFKRDQRTFMEQLSRQQSDCTLLDSYQRAAQRTDQRDELQQQLLLGEPGDERALEESRNAEVRQIAATIAELTRLFAEVNDQIVAQGSIVDRIDMNIESAAAYVAAALPEVEEAHETVTQQRRWTCFCVMFGFFLLLLLALMMVLKYVR